MILTKQVLNAFYNNYVKEPEWLPLGILILPIVVLILLWAIIADIIELIFE